MPLAGRPMIEWSLEAFRASAAVSAIVVAVPPGFAKELGDDVTVVDGGAERVASVSNALAVVETELVAIHDAARPLLTAELVEDLVAALDADPEAAGVIAAAPVTDTIKHADGRAIERTLDRSRLWAAQTPQVFRAEALREASGLRADARDAATDEAMLIEAAGGKVTLYPSSPENFKVTTALDLRVAELLLAERSVPQ